MPEEVAMNIKIVVNYKNETFNLGLSITKDAITKNNNNKSNDLEECLKMYFNNCLNQIGATLGLPNYWMHYKLDENYKNREEANNRRAEDCLKDFRGKEENKDKIIWECSPNEHFNYYLEFEKLKEKGNITIFTNPYRPNNYVKKYD